MDIPNEDDLNLETQFDNFMEIPNEEEVQTKLEMRD